MAKKKDESKCVKCGFRVALAAFHILEAEFDQEPYDDGTIEPVIIDGQNINSIEIEGSYSCHICPNCGWIRDVDVIDS